MGPGAAPVVDARFCSPQATAFTLTKTRRLEFTVTDDAGTAVMRVEAATLFFLPCGYRLLDAASSRPVLTVKRSPARLGALNRWKVFIGDSTSVEDLLFVVVPKPWLFTLPEVYVHLAGGDPSERHPNFVITRRGFCGRESTVYRGGAVVAQISRRGQLRWLRYNVSINAGIDHAFILALTVILEAINRHRES